MSAKRIAATTCRCLRALKRITRRAASAITLHDMPPRLMRPVPVECRWRSRGTGRPIETDRHLGR